uniref:Uncharacterized protein n=1 Tax=Glossina pallidipes TaxID=7398 RepID=A0A1B0AHF1_GLOPL
MIYKTDNDVTLSSLPLNICRRQQFGKYSLRLSHENNPISENDLLAAANHQNGFKGFRKQFSGRFKRLVSKKSESTSPIPPELRPQLKTIYVY